MKHIPRAPREGINVSAQHPLGEAATLVLGLGVLFLGFVLILVFLVELMVFWVSPETEARIFSGWMPVDLEAPPETVAGQGEAQALLDRLVVHWPDCPYDLRLSVVEDDTINALALPGGLIVVTRGLLNGLEAENELAFVLGHEIGHYRNRDHLRGLGRGVALSLLTVVVFGQDAGGLGLHLTDLTLKGFSRTQEHAADEHALETVHGEYGHVAGSWRFFDRLEDADALGPAFGAYFSTHPRTPGRIENMRDLAAQRGWPVTGTLTGWNMSPLEAHDSLR